MARKNVALLLCNQGGEEKSIIQPLPAFRSSFPRSLLVVSFDTRFYSFACRSDRVVIIHVVIGARYSLEEFLQSPPSTMMTMMMMRYQEPVASSSSVALHVHNHLLMTVQKSLSINFLDPLPSPPLYEYMSLSFPFTGCCCCCFVKQNHRRVLHFKHTHTSKQPVPNSSCDGLH